MVRIHMGYRAQKSLSRILAALIRGVILLIVLFPVYWMILTAIKPSHELYKEITLWTWHPTLDNLRNLFKVTPFLIQLRNSLLVCGTSLVGTVIAAVLAGYSLSRLHYPGRDTISGIVFFAYLMPGTMTLIPLYILMRNLGLLNTLVCLILIYFGSGLPFCIWMMKGYFMTIPYELEDAALVDGCTRLQALYKVVLPLAMPGIVASAIFTFTASWNDVLMPLVMNNKATLWTLPVGLAGLVYGDVYLWGEIMGGAVIMSIPVIGLYMFGQRFVVSGLAAGAVKG